MSRRKTTTRPTRTRARPSPGNDTRGFFARVYDVVAAIPRGRVATYGDVARLLGVPHGARAVGWALRALSGSVEAYVPWHRVVGHGGRISLRAGFGPQVQERRLRAEGVAFVGGRVDFTRHAFLGATQEPLSTRRRADPQSRLTRGRPRDSRAR